MNDENKRLVIERVPFETRQARDRKLNFDMADIEARIIAQTALPDTVFNSSDKPVPALTVARLKEQVYQCRSEIHNERSFVDRPIRGREAFFGAFPRTPHTLFGTPLFESAIMTEDKTVRRSWRERLWSWPWRPWRTHKVIRVPQNKIIRTLDGFFAHPVTVKRIHLMLRYGASDDKALKMIEEMRDEIPN